MSFVNSDGLKTILQNIKDRFSPKSQNVVTDGRGYLYEDKPIKSPVVGIEVKGKTTQNLWVNPSGTKNGVTVTSNEDGSLTLNGTATQTVIIGAKIYRLKPSSSYLIKSDKVPGSAGNATLNVTEFDSSGSSTSQHNASTSGVVFTTSNELSYASCRVIVAGGYNVSGNYRVMLREATAAEIAAAQQTASTLQEGGTADLPQDHPVTLPAYPIADSEEFDWCPPGLTSVSELALNVSGKNLVKQVVYAFPSTTSNGFTFDDKSVTVAFDAVKGETYTFSSTPAPDRSSYGYIDTDRIERGTKYSDRKNASISGNTIKVTAERSGTMFLYVMFTKNESVAASAQVELGTEATAYEPYVGFSLEYDIPFYINSINLGDRIYTDTATILLNQDKQHNLILSKRLYLYSYENYDDRLSYDEKNKVFSIRLRFQVSNYQYQYTVCSALNYLTSKEISSGIPGFTVDYQTNRAILYNLPYTSTTGLLTWMKSVDFKLLYYTNQLIEYNLNQDTLIPEDCNILTYSSNLNVYGNSNVGSIECGLGGFESSVENTTFYQPNVVFENSIDKPTVAVLPEVSKDLFASNEDFNSYLGIE